MAQFTSGCKDSGRGLKELNDGRACWIESDWSGVQRLARIGYQVLSYWKERHDFVNVSSIFTTTRRNNKTTRKLSSQNHKTKQRKTRRKARSRIQENESFKRFVDAVLDVWALILGVSILSLPRTTPLRLFFSAWVCYSLAINTVFQAYLTTYLVDPGFEKSITSIEELFASGTKYGFFSTYFDRNFNDKANSKDVEILRNRIDCDDMVTCLLWTAKYRNISSIGNPELVEYLYYGSKYSDKFSGYRPCELKEMPVVVTDLLMAVQKGSIFLDRMNEIICRLVEAGISTYLVKTSPEARKYFKAISSASKTLADEYHALTMNNMQSAFYLLLLGHSLGLISFLMEMLYFKMHPRRP
ncbi:uncharacterized protein LOC117282325 [Cryptotermes secundus]|uniref:uncharacterized protein LOC117282325 n=1 Tax=Cryptotermes secundus TaxID=105785 RepID=UPI001454D92B|nr:uncharacterized protein LOC117282325 [Cryptotermes secundus]